MSEKREVQPALKNEVRRRDDNKTVEQATICSVNNLIIKQARQQFESNEFQKREKKRVCISLF